MAIPIFVRAFVVILALSAALAGVPQPAAPSLDRGYRDAYDLNFAGAQQEFCAWEAAHPGEALGPVSEAAGLLFSELNRMGVLETKFFASDSAFEKRQPLTPDPEVKSRFEAALGRAESEAQRQLAADPKNPSALFAMTLTYGLRADYTALIENRNFASLNFTKQADVWARKLLAVAPDDYDAYLATGISKYILGSLAAPVRWLLRLDGYSGDKSEGLRELKLAADRGHYLAPFARMLLAIAALRNHDPARARVLLAGLRDDFPANPLFAKEIARLDARRSR